MESWAGVNLDPVHEGHLNGWEVLGRKELEVAPSLRVGEDE